MGPVWVKMLFYIAVGLGLIALGVRIAPSKHSSRTKSGIRFALGLLIALAGGLLIFVAVVGAWMIFQRAGVAGLWR